MEDYFVKPGKQKPFFPESESLLERKIKKGFVFCVFFLLLDEKGIYEKLWELIYTAHVVEKTLMRKRQDI